MISGKIGKVIDLKTLKDIHLGETAILFGSGPSVKKFDFSKISDELLFGVNECIFLECQLDYLFVRDFRNDKVKKINQELNNYVAKKGKFLGRDDTTTVANGIMKGSYWYNAAGTKGSRGDHKARASFWCGHERQKIAVYGSTSFDAIQFALWMGIKKIYLVGHDCNYSGGTFKTKRGSKSKLRDEKKLVDHWNLCKDWVNKAYPDVEIYSVNPVALKMFPKTFDYQLEE